jgi:hypothetical protein
MTPDRYIATVLVYSGRPDPHWEIEGDRLEGVKKLWEGLPPSSTPPPRAPLLGYRGCAVHCTSGEQWFGYEGVVAFKSGATGRAGYRLDPKRLFEKAVLETAPAGALPRQFRIPP